MNLTDVKIVTQGGLVTELTVNGVHFEGAAQGYSISHDAGTPPLLHLDLWVDKLDLAERKRGRAEIHEAWPDPETGTIHG